MLRKQLLPTPNAVVTGQTSVIDLDLGKRYAAVWLEVGDSGAILSGASLIANIAKLVTQIRVKINGRVQRTMTGQELHLLYSLVGAQYGAKSYGTDSAATNYYRVFLPIWFSEPWRNNNHEVDLTAVNAVGIDSFQIEVDIASGLTTPVLTGWYEYSEPTGGMGAMVKWIRQSLGASGTVQDFNQLTKQDFVQSISLFPPTSGFVNKVRLTANNNVIHDLLNTNENQALLLARGLVPETGTAAANTLSGGAAPFVANNPRFDLVFDYDDPINNALLAQGLNEFTVHVEYGSYSGGNIVAASTSGTMVAILQRTGPPE
jgi:hypothetical protein